MGNLCRKRRVMIGLCMALLLGCLTGCKDKERSTYESTTYLYFSWWGNDARHQYTLDGIERFMSDTDNAIQVYSKYSNWGGYENRMRIYMKSHDAPDVMQINYAWLQEYGEDETSFYDLYRLSDEIALNNYTEEELSFGIVNGKLYALPIAFNTQAFYYNQDLYDAYGLSLPETFEDLFTAAVAMREDGVYPIGVSEKQLFLLLISYLEQTTGQPATEDGKLLLSKEEIRCMLEFYDRLLEEKVIMPVDDFSVNAFSTGKTAGTVTWISDASNYCTAAENAGHQVAIGEYLYLADAKAFGWKEKPATMYAISAATEHPKEAGQLLDYLLNSKDMALLQGTEKGIPISNAARRALEDRGKLTGYEKEADDIRVAHASELGILSPVLENEEVYTAFKQNADYYIYGRLSEEEVIDLIDQAYEAYR